MSSDAIPAYEMTLSLNVLNHLGLNLYSNLPAVLSEAVANAWDADATKVSIEIDAKANTVRIADNGVGMTPKQVNERYLQVGYERRKDSLNPAGAKTAMGRDVMGRKGIGKLSLFSIARTIEVRTAAYNDAKDPARGLQNAALRLDLKDIRACIESQAGKYHPEVLDEKPDRITSGTEIILRNPRKDLSRTAAHLRRRLARRFSMTASNFEISVNGNVVTPADRDIAKRCRYLWIYGPEEYVASVRSLVPDAQAVFVHSGITGRGDQVQGWVGTASTSTDLQPDDDDDESLNRIAIMVRNKLAQEDVLQAVAPGGIFTRYLSGEISADFLDRDDQEDIATSSRQGLLEEDPRFVDFRAFLKDRVREIGSEWTRLRAKDGVQDAVQQVPAIDDWLGTLKGDKRDAAESFISKINAMEVDDDSRRRLYSSGVIAFEQLQRTERLRILETVDESSLPDLIGVFESIDDIEAAMYYDIVKERLSVIEKFQGLADDNVLEKVLQEYLFDHLWLLDPGWDRAFFPSMEKSIAKLTGSGGQQDRVDIKYRNVGSSHVIVELKRANRVVSTMELAQQIEKYRVPILASLKNSVGEGVDLQVVCVVGKPLRDWANDGGRKTSKDVLRSINARVVLYSELVESARSSYSEYLEANAELGKVRQILSRIEAEIYPS